jgi:hypothetical protein
MWEVACSLNTYACQGPRNDGSREEISLRGAGCIAGEIVLGVKVHQAGGEDDFWLGVSGDEFGSEGGAGKSATVWGREVIPIIAGQMERREDGTWRSGEHRELSDSTCHAMVLQYIPLLRLIDVTIP